MYYNTLLFFKKYSILVYILYNILYIPHTIYTSILYIDLYFIIVSNYYSHIQRHDSMPQDSCGCIRFVDETSRRGVNDSESDVVPVQLSASKNGFDSRGYRVIGITMEAEIGNSSIDPTGFQNAVLASCESCVECGGGGKFSTILQRLFISNQVGQCWVSLQTLKANENSTSPRLKTKAYIIPSGMNCCMLLSPIPRSGRRPSQSDNSEQAIPREVSTVSLSEDSASRLGKEATSSLRADSIRASRRGASLMQEVVVRQSDTMPSASSVHRDIKTKSLTLKKVATKNDCFKMLLKQTNNSSQNAAFLVSPDANSDNLVSSTKKRPTPASCSSFESMTTTQTPSIVTYSHLSSASRTGSTSSLSPSWDDSYSPEDGTPLTSQGHSRGGNVSQYGIAYSPSSGREIREGSMYIPDVSHDEFSRSILIDFNEAESHVPNLILSSSSSSSAPGSTSIFQSVMQGSGAFYSKPPESDIFKTQGSDTVDSPNPKDVPNLSGLITRYVDIEVYISNLSKSVDEFFSDKKNFAQEQIPSELFGRSTLAKIADEFKSILISCLQENLNLPPINTAFHLTAIFTRSISSQSSPRISSMQLTRFVSFTNNVLKLFRLMLLSLIQTKFPSIADGIDMKDILDQIVLFMCIVQVSFQSEILRVLYNQIGDRSKKLGSNFSKMLRVCKKDVEKSIDSSITKIQLLSDSPAFSQIDCKSSIFCIYDISRIADLFGTDNSATFFKVIPDGGTGLKRLNYLMDNKASSASVDNSSSSGRFVKSVLDAMVSSFHSIREKLDLEYSLDYFNPENFLNEIFMRFFGDEDDNNLETVDELKTKKELSRNQVLFSFFNETESSCTDNNETTLNSDGALKAQRLVSGHANESVLGVLKGGTAVASSTITSSSIQRSKSFSEITDFSVPLSSTSSSSSNLLLRNSKTSTTVSHRADLAGRLHKTKSFQVPQKPMSIADKSLPDNSGTANQSRQKQSLSKRFFSELDRSDVCNYGTQPNQHGKIRKIGEDYHIPIRSRTLLTSQTPDNSRMIRRSVSETPMDKLKPRPRPLSDL